MGESWVLFGRPHHHPVRRFGVVRARRQKIRSLLKARGCMQRSQWGKTLGKAPQAYERYDNRGKGVGLAGIIGTLLRTVFVGTAIACHEYPARPKRRVYVWGAS